MSPATICLEMMQMLKTNDNQSLNNIQLCICSMQHQQLGLLCRQQRNVNYCNDSRSPQVCLDFQRNVFGLLAVVVHKRAVVFLGSSANSYTKQLQKKKERKEKREKKKIKSLSAPGKVSPIHY